MTGATPIHLSTYLRQPRLSPSQRIRRLEERANESFEAAMAIKERGIDQPVNRGLYLRRLLQACDLYALALKLKG